MSEVIKMNDMDDLINKKISELTNQSIKVDNNNLMEVLRANFVLLEDKLYLYCRLANVSFIDTVIDILESYGFKDLDKKVVTTYLNRLRKERGKYE